MAKQKTFVFFITMIAALGGFLFGFDMAVVSGIVGLVKEQFGLSASSEGWFVSSALLGCILGVAFSGYLSDKIGRKKVLFIAASLFLISAIGFAHAWSYPVLILFRILAGVAVGVASNISPLYISEMSPAHKRGGLVTFYQLAITIGILVAYISNYFLQRHAASVNLTGHVDVITWLFVREPWRGMFLVGAIPAILFCLLIMLVPESPRWLFQQNNQAKAKDVLTALHGEQEAEQELRQMSDVTTASAAGLNVMFKPPIRKVLIMAMILTALSQFSGINGVIFYGPTILKSAGIVSDEALLYQIILGGANMLFTYIAIWKVDTWGRRPLYLVGSLAAATALILTAICFLADINGILLVSCIVSFLLAFAFSLGPLKFVIATEIFPTHIRGSALSVCIMTMWVSDWVVNLLFPLMRDGLGVAFTFFIFAFFCLLSFVYAKRNLPETKGWSLEEIEKKLMY